MGAKRTKAQQKRYLEKKRIRKQKIRRTIKLLNCLTGQFTEQKFFDAFNSSDLPYWLTAMRKAGRKLDRQGVDAIAETDCGLFYIQIKGSEIGALKFKNQKRHAGIPVIVTLKKDTPTFIRQQTIDTLREIRKTVLAQKETVATV